MTRVIEAMDIARKYRAELIRDIQALGTQPRLVGILASDQPSSRVYATYTEKCCRQLGIVYDLLEIPSSQVRDKVMLLNRDDSVQGMIVYYPMINREQDKNLRHLVDHRKDIEGLSPFWLEKLYQNVRYIDDKQTKKSVLPCTPLSALKMLDAAYGLDSAFPNQHHGRTYSVFNRSEVVGEPLAYMLANDGGRVYSFDLKGVVEFAAGQKKSIDLTRKQALERSDCVITGVPNPEFTIDGDELKQGAVCLNFSEFENFSSNIDGKASVHIPRIGAMTTTMAARNMVRLFRNYWYRYD